MLSVRYHTMAQPSQADVFAALSAQGSFRKPAKPSAPFSAFSDPSTELITSAGASAEAGSSRVNATRVYCPREGCGSLILLENAAKVVESQIEVVSQSRYESPIGLGIAWAPCGARVRLVGEVSA